MLSTNERMGLIHKVLERLRSEVHPPRHGRLTAYEYFLDADNPLALAEAEISLDGLLERLGPMPPGSVLIGMCEDGLPFLFDLTDPSPGSILIVGDSGSGKTHLLQSIIGSACALNRPDEVKVSVISSNPGEFEALNSMKNCRAVLSCYDRAASELVMELAELAGQRRNGMNRGTVEILAIDDLPAFHQNSEYEINRYLEWLAVYGPQAAIWVIATVKTSQVWRIRKGLYEVFGTQLMGMTSSIQLSAQADYLPTDKEQPGVFSVLLGDEPVRFWSPGNF